MDIIDLYLWGIFALGIFIIYFAIRYLYKIDDNEKR